MRIALGQCGEDSRELNDGYGTGSGEEKVSFAILKASSEGSEGVWLGCLSVAVIKIGFGQRVRLVLTYIRNARAVVLCIDSVAHGDCFQKPR